MRVRTGYVIQWHQGYEVNFHVLGQVLAADKVGFTVRWLHNMSTIEYDYTGPWDYTKIVVISRKPLKLLDIICES